MLAMHVQQMLRGTNQTAGEFSTVVSKLYPTWSTSTFYSKGADKRGTRRAEPPTLTNLSTPLIVACTHNLHPYLQYARLKEKRKIHL